MSSKTKKKSFKPIQARLLEISPQADIPPKQAAQIRQLMANRQVGRALDLAKQLHQRYANASSEALLVDAYLAQIDSLLGQNFNADAKVLINFIRENFPASAGRLEDASALLAAQQGDLDALLQPLSLPSLPPEKHALIDKYIRCYAVDLVALSQCGSLPPGHPLRTGAAALARTFTAATSGPVEDDALALPEIFRGSPLAPWKMLLRAIVAFYRHDDQLCERCLAAIEPDAAAFRLAPALRAMMGQAATLTPAARDLVSQSGGNLEMLRSKLRGLDQALAKSKISQSQAISGIQDSVAACREFCPEALEPLMHLILAHALVLGDIDPDAVENVLQPYGPLKNASFWRLMARAFEEEKDPIAMFHACAAWEEFRRHALHQKWFPAKGPELATLYLHMADLLGRLPREDFEFMRREFDSEFDGNGWHYEKQPAALRALSLRPGKKDLYFARVEELMERACEADPATGNFQRWLDWSRQGRPASIGDSVAGKWRMALPNDVQPVLHLMESAEKTGAFQRAFDFMEIAERLDSLNPEVRKARLRLLVAMALRYLQQKKPKKVEKEVCAIEALPQAQQGDRPAFLAALRCVSSMLSGNKELAAGAGAEVAARLNGEIAAYVVLTGIVRNCKLKLDLPKPEAGAASRLAAQIGRACALGGDMNVLFEIPPVFSEPLFQELTKPGPAAEFPGLAALGQAALNDKNLPLAYAISGAGLSSTGPSGGEALQAQCLFLRARALPPWEIDRHDACLGAASELARRQRDLGLLHEIGAWRTSEDMDFNVPLDKSDIAMSTERINQVLQQEIKHRAYPLSAPPRLPGLPGLPGTSRVKRGGGKTSGGKCNCPACRAGMPPMPPEIMDMLEDLGPDAAARVLEQMLNNIGGRPGRKKGKGPKYSDFPF